MMRRIFKDASVVCLVLLLHSPSAVAEAVLNGQLSLSDPYTHSPKTNANKHHEDIPQEIASWITVSTLIDLEWQGEELSIRGGGTDSISEDSAKFQLGLIATPWEFLKVEIDLEYETTVSHLLVDEAFVEFKRGEWGLKAGKLYTPFGEYISHFISSPLLKFGETRGNGITLSLASDEIFDLSLTAYSGKARKVGGHPSRIDWVAAIAANIDDEYRFGLSYQSDLADAKKNLLADQDSRFQRKVDAVSGYFVWAVKEFELSFEVLGALDSFQELDPDRDQPMAWNLEFVHFVNHDLEWALRAEGGRELKGKPEWQLGTALTWHVNQNVTCSAEYLHGHYKNGFVTNDADEPYDHVDQVGVQISLGF